MAPTVWHVIVPGRLLGGCSRHYQSWHFSDWRRCGVEGSGQKVVWEAEAPGTGGSSLNVTRSLRRGS